MVREACEQHKVDRNNYRFRRRDVRACTGWGDTQLKLHLRRLVDMEYLLVHRSVRGRSFAYELLYNGQGEGGHRHPPGQDGAGRGNAGSRIVRCLAVDWPGDRVDCGGAAMVFKGVVRDGSIEIPRDADLPDGTVVRIEADNGGRFDDLADLAGTWEGDDADRVLDEIHATRSSSPRRAPLDP
jgi:hypothetical protein